MAARRAFCLAFLCGAFVSTPATAALIERDWLAPGDGLLTYDDVNHREWLDLDVSELSQFGSLIDDAVAAAKLELLPGGRFEGFTLAGREEVDQLVVSSGFDSSSYESTLETADQMRALILLIGGPERLDELSGAAELFGVIDETASASNSSQPTSAAVLFTVENRAPTRPNGRGSYGYDNQSNDRYKNYDASGIGIMLYRNSVPEPSAALLIAMAISLLRCRRRSHQNALHLGVA